MAQRLFRLTRRENRSRRARLQQWKVKMARALTALLLVAALSLMSHAAAQAQSIEIMPRSSRPASKGAQTFTGPVSITPLFGMKDQTRITAGRVTFEPGARAAWHTHPAGQI